VGVKASDEATYLSMLESFLDSEHFYFSYKYDLSKSIQQQATAKDVTGAPLWKRVSSTHARTALISVCLSTHSRVEGDS
jgi:hypothetical protein